VKNQQSNQVLDSTSRIAGCQGRVRAVCEDSHQLNVLASERSDTELELEFDPF